jgi:acyl carrier protein phosphodiesterase
MANRAKFNSQMEHGVEDLERYYDDFEAEFTEFFPILVAFVNNKIPTIE